MEKLFSEKMPNKGRQFEIDCVKFFAIFWMVCIHVYENMSVVVDYAHKPGTIFQLALEFLGGPLAAPVFMFSMGVGMVYTRHNEWKDFVKRGIKLLITAYVLNFLRLTILLIISGIFGFEFAAAPFDFTQSILVVDILQFAGMTFITIGIMKYFRLRREIILMIAVILQAAGIWANKLVIGDTVPALLLGLLLPTHLAAAFPLTLWLVYPAAGLLFGEILMKVTDKKIFYRRILIVSSVAFAGMTSALVWTGFDLRDFFALADDIYYLQNFLSTLWIILLAFIFISVCYFLLSWLEKKKAGTFIKFCSSNLNTIYIIQWLIIMYAIYVAERLGMSIALSQEAIIPVGLLIIALAIFAAFVYSRIKISARKKRETKQ